MSESATLPLQSLLENLQSRLSAVESQMGICSGKTTTTSNTPSSSVKQDSDSVSVQAYDEYLRTCLTPFLGACDKLGTEVSEYGKLVSKAFAAQRAYLVRASCCKKPAQVASLLADLQACMKEINQLRDNRSEFAHHQNMLNEGVQSLGWLCVEPAPKPFIESYIGGSDFWGNKIRVAFKTTNPDQVNFVTTFKSLLTGLMAYVKEYHTTGVTWNPNGVAVDGYQPSSTPSPASAAAPPAPAAAGGGGGLNAVFAGIRNIDQSSGKTAGLKTVTKDMQTWRKEYSGDDKKKPVAAAPAKAKAKVFGSAAAVKKNPVCELKNGKWVIEHQYNIAEPLVVKDINMKQQVYIFGCENATIILEGKAKNIVLDTAKKTKLLFDDAVSSIEVVNCKNVQVQCKGQVPSVAIDKTDGCLVYVSYIGKSTQFVTSKSSEMNVAFPASATSDDYIEKPIPEQFVHSITDEDGISSDVSDLYSH